GDADLAEGAVVLVVVERADAELVADEQVRPAIVVVIGPGSGQTPGAVMDAGGGADLGERAVAVVVVQAVGYAVVGFPVGQRRGVLVVAHAHHVHVEEAVAVIVGDHRHARPHARRDAGGRRHIGEGATG